MKPFLFGLILAALLATPISSDAALFRRRARVLARPRTAVVVRAPARRVVVARPRVVRGAVRVRGVIAGY
jgi:hypothetical protein